VAHDPPLEQARIAGQQDAVLVGRNMGKLLVACIASPAIKSDTRVSCTLEVNNIGVG
jgi:hypothetical protein